MIYQYIHRLAIFLTSSEKQHFCSQLTWQLTQKHNWSPWKEKDIVECSVLNGTYIPLPTFRDHHGREVVRARGSGWLQLSSILKSQQGDCAYVTVVGIACTRLVQDQTRQNSGWWPQNPTATQLRSYWKLMAARKVSFKNAAPEIWSYTLTHPDSNELNWTGGKKGSHEVGRD